MVKVTLNPLTPDDRAVMQAYGFSVKDMSEADCVAELMKMYQELVNQQTKQNTIPTDESWGCDHNTLAFYFFSLQVDIQQTVELLTHQFVNLRYN